MSQATRSIEVDVTPEQLFDVITDFERYPEYMGDLGMTGARVISKSDTTAEVESTVKKLGKLVTYTLRYELKRPQLIKWSFVEGNLMKDNRGSWELEALDGGRTRAKYTIEVSFGWLVPKAVIAKLIATELPTMLNAFKRRAESIGG